MQAAETWLRHLDGGAAFGLFLVENLVILLGALAAGALVQRLWRNRPLGPPAPPLEKREILLAALTVPGNAVVTWIGWWLWRQGWIVIEDGGLIAALVDTLVLTLAMDGAMYALHRTAHHRWLYPRLHAPHHLYDRPRPLTLFVLHPLEVAGFGGLWLVVLAAVQPCWAGMIAYLVLNVVWGTLGHCAVEPFPRGFERWPVLGLIADAGFHHRHHTDPHGNFGFYTRIWDRWLGTAGQADRGPQDVRRAA